MTLAPVAKDFGIHEMTLNKWSRKADASQGSPAVAGAAQDTELRALKCGNRLLEQENEVLRRAAAYLSQANLPPK